MSDYDGGGFTRDEWREFARDNDAKEITNLRAKVDKLTAENLKLKKTVAGINLNTTIPDLFDFAEVRFEVEEPTPRGFEYEFFPHSIAALKHKVVWAPAIVIDLSENFEITFYCDDSTLSQRRVIAIPVESHRYRLVRNNKTQPEHYETNFLYNDAALDENLQILAAEFLIETGITKIQKIAFLDKLNKIALHKKHPSTNLEKYERFKLWEVESKIKMLEVK